MYRRVPNIRLIRPVKQTVGGQRNFSLDPQIIQTLTESFQSIHSYSGIPWWALIPVSTFTLRTIWTLPLSIMQRKRLQKQSEYKAIISGTNPILKLNLGKEVMKAKKDLDKVLNDAKVSQEVKLIKSQSPKVNMSYEAILTLSAKETRKVQKTLFKKHNIQIWKNFLLPAFQIPLWIIMSLTMRNLSGWLSWDSLSNTPLDVSLYDEGVLWFTNLTASDQLHIIPVIYGLIYLSNIEWTAKSIELSRLIQRHTLRPTLMDSITNLTRVSVVFMMAVSFNAPVALCLYWVSSQIYSLIQNVVLDLVFPISYSPNSRIEVRESKNPEAVSLINAVSQETT